MKLKLLTLLTISLTSLSVNAQNEAYGTVDEMFLRSDNNGSSYIALRLNVMKDISSFESCVTDANNLLWIIDQSSPEAVHQYDLVKSSYKAQLPIKIIGKKDLCKDGEIYRDDITEISPLSWGYHLSDRG